MKNQKERQGQNKVRPHRRGVLGFIGRVKRRWIIVFIVIMIGVSAFLVSMKKMNSGGIGKAMSTFTVLRDHLTITVTESGSIKARESTDIICEVEGRGVEIANLVPEGTVITVEDVKNKKVICQLNASDLQDTYSREQIALSTAKAAYTDANEAYLIQQKQNESDIKAAELAVKFGLMDFQKYVGDTVAQKVIEKAKKDPNSKFDMASLLKDIEDPNSGSEASQKLRELSGAIGLAAANLEKATDTLEWTKKLYEKEYVAETELMKDKLDKQRIEIEKEKAEIALRLFKRYEFPKQVEQLLSDYEEAGRQLERAVAKARAMLAQARAKLDNAEATYKLQKEQVAKLERQIVACTIVAPSPGILVYGTSADYRQRREDPIEIGDLVHKGQKIFTIPHSNNLMDVELSVHESSVDKVHPNQPVTVTVEAFPDKTFPGKVVRVAPLPDPQYGWLGAGVKVYTTNVSIDEAYDFIKPGMSAKVEILVDELHDVIVVPIQAVANREGKKVCYVATSQGPKQREVQTGAFNDMFVQINEGLKVGEEVLLSPPRLIEPGVAARLKRGRKGPEDGRSPQGGGPSRSGKPS